MKDHRQYADFESFVQGDRVRMNALGLERHPSYGKREGVIVGRRSRKSLRVKFDDRTTIQAIYHLYLEHVRVGQPAGPVGATVGGVVGGMVGVLGVDERPRFRSYVAEQRRPSYQYREDVRVGVELPKDGVKYYGRSTGIWRSRISLHRRERSHRLSRTAHPQDCRNRRGTLQTSDNIKGPYFGMVLS